MAPALPQRQRVLIIDDDPILRELLAALLAAEDRVVDTVESGEAALAFLGADGCRDALPGVIATDIQLPGIAGAELAAQLRRAAPSAALLAMSGSPLRPQDRAAFQGFLLKPFTSEEFEAAVLAAQAAGSIAASRDTIQPPASSALATALVGPPALDERTYARLAASIPPAQLAQLYELTFSDIALRLALMRDALANGDAVVLRREAHALKGGCSMVGASELASLAALAELAEPGSSSDTPTVEEFSAAAERLRSIMTARSMLQP